MSDLPAPGVTGLVIVTHDVEPDVVHDWCRWYDLEHLPEYLALPGVRTAKRYLTTPELQSNRGREPIDAFAPGCSAFLTTYLLSDPDVRATWDRMQTETAKWNAAGRRFPGGGTTARYADLFAFEWAQVRPGLDVSPNAVPHLRHTGVQAALGEVSDREQRDVIDTWWRDVHAPDMLAVPGVLAALRFRSLLHDGRSLVLFLLDEDPVRVLARVPEHRERWLAAGRAPSPGGASKALFNGPYRALAPLGAVDGWCGVPTESTTGASAS